MTEIADINLREQIARIDRMREESQRLNAEATQLASERIKLESEAIKLAAESRKLERDRSLSGWQLVITGMASGAALVGATAALTAAAIKFLGP